MDWLVFVESVPFARHITDHLTDDEYRRFQTYLSANPTAGDLLQGTGGLRKVRWGEQDRGKGKRGGIRVVYYYFHPAGPILLFVVYGKGKKEDLTHAESRFLARLLKEEKARRRKP